MPEVKSPSGYSSLKPVKRRDLKIESLSMNVHQTLLAAGVIFAAVSSGQSATGLDWLDKNTNLTAYADLRLRYEKDWDSQNAAGVPRTDRDRGRVRARAGFNYQFSEQWSGGARIRTGNNRSQQSPHLTFASNDDMRDDLEFVVDRYFAQFKGCNHHRAGWQSLPPRF